MEALRHALLGVSVLALGGAGLRVASQMVPCGLARVIAAGVFAAAVAVAEGLALGLVGLGTNTAALVVAAVVTWALTVAALPAPERPLLAELGSFWSSSPPLVRLALGAVAGLGVAWTAWVLRHPSIGFDSSFYHYSEVAQWISNGRPGSQVTISYDLPFGSYPLTNEVLMAWGAGIARSFVPLALMTPLAYLLLGAAGWLGLRTLRVGRGPAVLALCVLLSAPWLIRELNEPLGDLTSLAWLAAASALCACAPRRPALLAPALLAVGLAMGTKTTAAVPAFAVLALAVYVLRARLRSLAPGLLAAAALALAVGGFWYLRNIIEHGSPTWPFMATPWGDPVPPFIDLVDTRFVERPFATLDGRWSEYGAALAGGVAVLAGSLLAPLVSRRREVLIAAGVTAATLVIWAMAPVTGLSDAQDVPAVGIWSLSTSRYLLPAIGAGCVTLALAAAGGGIGRIWSLAVLAAALVWNLIEVASLGLPYVPRLSTLLVGVTVGVCGAAVASFLPRAGAPRVPGFRGALPVAGAGALVAAAAGATLALASDGYLRRHAAVEQSSAVDARRLTAWFTTQPEFEDGDRPIFLAGRFFGAQLAGQRFQHRLELLPREASCREVERAAQRGWLVLHLRVIRGVVGVTKVPAADCRPRGRPVYDDGSFKVYSP